MYTLRLFGPPLLVGPDGPVPGRVAQDRKVALLAVLALTDGRSRTRDSLAAMFWPESAPSRARHSVADGLWVLRSSLGEDALVTRGNRVSLSPEVVSTDVEAFDRAVRDGELDEAVRVYAGPFMEGFHISGAPDFERWLDGERGRLAAAYVVALEHLVRIALEEGDGLRAATWARLMGSADPLNTRSALLLMEALATSGDVAGALRHGEAHGKLLSEEIGVAPPPEMEARIRELRTSPPPVAPLPRPAALPDSRSTQPSTFAPSSSPAPSVPERAMSPPGSPHTDQAGGSRARYAFLMAAVGLAGIAAVWLIPGVGSADAPLTVADRILVTSFENRTGDPELDLVGRMAADALVRGFVGSGVGDVILPEDMLGSGIGIEGGPVGPARAGVLAAEAGAGIAVSGTIDPHSEGAAFVALVATFPGPRVAAALDPVPFDPAKPDEALRVLRSRVLGTVVAHLGAALREHPFVVPTPSYEAYRSADRGARLFQSQQMDSAAVLFRRAYELDSTAVGYLLWEAVSLWNIRDGPRVQAILDRVRPRRDELSPFDDAHFDWLEARLGGDLPAAARASQAARARHPYSGLGGFQVGLDLVRLGRLDEALEAYLRLDPDRGWLAGYPHYWNNVAGVYHLMGRHEEELEVVEEGYRRFPGSILLNARIRALAALGRIPEINESIRRSADPPGHAMIAARALHRHGHQAAAVAVAEEGLRTLRAGPLAPEAFPATLRARRNTEARLLLAAGQLDEARGLFLELLAFQPTDHNLLGWIGFAEARLGMEDEARERIRTLRSLAGEPYRYGGPTVARAAIHAELGDDPAWIRLMLQQSHQEGWPLHQFHYMPLFDPVREHPDVRGFFQLRR